MNPFRPLPVIAATLLLGFTASAFAGPHWSYCRQDYVGDKATTYYSGVFYYQYGTTGETDPKIARDVRVAFRAYVQQISGVALHGDPYCWIPLNIHEATQAQAQQKRDDEIKALLTPKVVTAWHP